MGEVVRVVVVPESEWLRMLNSQAEILELVKALSSRDTGGSKVVPFITAMEFMSAVRIGRTKFDQLVAENKVRTIKKGRKIYVPIGEVERYFGNPDTN